MEITSKRINWDEILAPKIHTIKAAVLMTREDFEWEDTITIPVTMPRGAWKCIYAFASGSGCGEAEVISDFLCDKVATIMGGGHV